MIEIILDQLLLKAASFFVGKNSSRIALDGVYFDLFNCNLQATNGQVAFISKPNSIQIENISTPKGFIMPPEMLSQLLAVKIGKQESERQIVIQFEPNRDLITATLSGISFSMAAVNARYPDFSRVYHLDDTDLIEAPCYDFKYLKLIADTQKTLMPFTAKEDTGVLLKKGFVKSIFSVANDLAHIIVMGMRTNLTFSFYNLTKDKK